MGTKTSRPLARLLLRQLTGVYLLLALAISGAQLLWKYGEDKAKLLRTLASLSDTFAPGITKGLWVLEDDLVTAFTDGLKNDPTVALVQLADPEGHLLFEWKAPTSRPPSNELRVTRDLVWLPNTGEEQPLGRLVLASSGADLERALSADLGQTILLLLVLLFAVVLALWLFLQARVVVPLRSFAGQVDDLLRSQSGGLVVLKGHRTVEVESLQKNFNSLLEQILTRQAEIERDNTLLEQRVAERTKDLEAAKRTAEEASRAKGEFLANMSHEIRTPMNAILGFTHLVETTSLDGVQSDYIGKIHESATTLLNIINDILDFSKIDAGKLELSESDFRLRDTVRRALDLIQFDAQQKEVGLVLNLDERLPDYLRGDPLRLGQVLANLLTNAVKFTAEGTITLTVDRVNQDETGTTCRFTVADTGIGMEEHQLARLFQPFTQADGSITRRYGGTGLGLVISRRLVELMGGTIDVQSTPGLGSSFAFTTRLALGVAPAEAPRVQNELDPQRRGGKILLVEDNPLNQLLARELLRKHGLEVTVADNGLLALEALKAHRFDLVFMDQQMPVMDGLEATRALRSNPALARLPVVAMTANVMPSSRDDCLAAGMNDFLTKPLVWSELFRVLNQWLPLQGAPASTTSGPPSPHPAPSLTPARYPEVDVAELLDRLMGDRDLLLEVIHGFLASVDASLGGITQACEGSRYAEAAVACHGLKGMAANLSLHEVHAASFALETALKSPGGTDLPPLLAELQTAVGRAKRRLEAVAGAT